MHDLDRQQLEYARTHANGGAGELSESGELELAAELLEVATEEELVKWLGNIASRAQQAVRPLQRATGKAFVANPKAVETTIRAVKTVLPPISAAVGFLQGMPPDLAIMRANQLSGAIDINAIRLKALMDRWSKQELEGLTGEERELEYARRYTRFAHRALRNAWRAPRRMAPERAAYLSVRHAARRDLPGLVPHITQIFHIGANELATTGAGRWHRTRNAIVIDLG
jgi:hypothetical protein